MKSVAPNWRATASLAGLASMTTMRPAAAMRARLHDRQADAADADDDDGLAGPHLGPVEHRAGAGDDARSR